MTRTSSVTRSITQPSVRLVSKRLVATLAVAIVAGCGANDRDTASAPGASQMPQGSRTTTTAFAPLPGPYTITIRSTGYSHLSAPAGEQGKIINDDDVEHSVTSDTPGVFDINVQPHSTEIFVFPVKPGTYTYHDTHQTSLHGELVIY